MSSTCFFVKKLKIMNATISKLQNFEATLKAVAAALFINFFYRNGLLAATFEGLLLPLPINVLNFLALF